MKRLDTIPGFSIDRVAQAAGDDPDVLRLENLDTDLAPPAALAATPMRDWGEQNGDPFVRLVFSNEPAERLATLRERVEAALG